MDQTKFLLNETDLSKTWYNMNADLPGPPPPVLHPGTQEPVTPDFLSVLFPMALIMQEVSTDRYIDIPEEVREIYKLWRPTPLIRARRLEKALDTPAHIYYKHEGVSPSGSHKPNTAVAQAFFNKAEGINALTTETGAGQWGSALAMATKFFGLSLEVYMVKVQQTRPSLENPSWLTTRIIQVPLESQFQKQLRSLQHPVARRNIPSDLSSITFLCTRPLLAKKP